MSRAPAIWVRAASSCLVAAAVALSAAPSIPLAQPNEAPPQLVPEEDGPGLGAIVIDPRTGEPRVLNAPPPETDSDRRARARLRAEEAARAREEAGEAPLDEDQPAFSLDDLDSLGGAGLRPGAPLPEDEPAPPVPGQRVVLRGVDKLTGDLGEAEAAVGETAVLWRLEIDVRACFARPELGESAGSAFLQIRDTKPDPAEMVFSGWMFAASPALSAMDHPRYDVWVLSCKTS